MLGLLGHDSLPEVQVIVTLLHRLKGEVAVIPGKVVCQMTRIGRRILQEARSRVVKGL